MWAAIRYRRAQALVLLVLSALISGCAVFAALYERALEQSLLRDGLIRQNPFATSLVAEVVQSREVPPVASTLRSTFPAPLAAFYDRGSELWSGYVNYAGVAKDPSLITVVAPQDTCRSLQIVQGTCPSQPFEVAVSAAEATVQGWTVGTELRATEHLLPPATAQPFPQPFVVTAFFRQLDDPGHWQGIGLEGRAGRFKPAPSDEPLMDGWVTPTSTFTPAWKADRLDVVWLLDRDRITLEGLEGIPPAIDQMRYAGVTQVPTVVVRTSVPDLVAGVLEGQRQARTLVPLLLGQLAVLAVVVLGLVASAAVDQRRPELALARLRGRSPGGAARVILLELGTVVAAGVPVGFLLALGLGEVSRRFWLAQGVPFELPVTTFVAALVSLIVGVLAVAVVTRPPLRESISTLLRRVPPRRRGWTVGIVDAVIVAVATAGLVTLSSGNVSGPLVLATPTLIALALGLVVATVLIPSADRVARRLTERGRLVGALTAVLVARRPAVRRIIAIITVATALTVFATDALVVGARNREERARVETGAEAVLTTTARDITSLTQAVATADPTGAVATPVVRVRQGSSTAITTLAVRPQQFPQIAELPRTPEAFSWNAIGVAPPPEIILTGRSFSVGVTDIALTAVPFAGAGSSDAPPVFLMFLAPLGAAPFAVPLGDLPVGSGNHVTFTRDVSCASGCRIAGFGLRPGLGFRGQVRGTFVVTDVTMDGSSPAPVGDPTQWLPSGQPDAPKDKLVPYAKAVAVGEPSSIGLEASTDIVDVQISSRGTAAPLPALVLGPLPSNAPGPAFQGAGLDGTTLDYTQVAQIPYAPGGGSNEALVNLDALTQRSTALAPTALAQVWLANAGAVDTVRASLEHSGINVASVDLRSEREQLFDSSASAWGLRLALVVGLVALVIAAVVLVLVAATSWRTRARDFAALRMAGVATAQLRRCGFAEQWTVVLVSVLLGAGSGMLGGQLAMPLIPFFTIPSAVLPIDTSPALGYVGVAACAALLVLLVVGAIVGLRLVARSTLSRVREQI